MKREILFRGKRIDNGAWVEGFYSNLFEEPTNKEESVIVFQHFEGADMSCPYPTCNTIYAVVDENTVGQFTGLTDKNGVKIFEGDIIDSSDRIYKLRDFDDLIELYYWHRECVILEEYTTIIGNIHENQK